MSVIEIYHLLGAQMGDRRLDTMTLPTWTGKSRFKYEGNVRKGTRIWFGRNERPLTVSGSQYTRLLDHFKGQEVSVGASRDKPQRGSLGEWLQQNVVRTAIASYLAQYSLQRGTHVA